MRDGRGFATVLWCSRLDSAMTCLDRVEMYERIWPQFHEIENICKDRWVVLIAQQCFSCLSKWMSSKLIPVLKNVGVNVVRSLQVQKIFQIRLALQQLFRESCP